MFASRVDRIRRVAAGDPDKARQAGCEHAGPQRRLERQPGRQIGRQRERTEQFAEPHERTSTSFGGSKRIVLEGELGCCRLSPNRIPGPRATIPRKSRGTPTAFAAVATATPVPPDTARSGDDSAASRGMTDLPAIAATAHHRTSHVRATIPRHRVGWRTFPLPRAMATSRDTTCVGDDSAESRETTNP